MTDLVEVEGKVTKVIHDGTQMIVLNKGKTSKVPESSLELLAPYIVGGEDDDDAEETEDGLKDARAEYLDVFGKRPGPKWTEDEIRAKIADAKAADTDEGEDDEGEGEEGGEGAAPAA